MRRKKGGPGVEIGFSVLSAAADDTASQVLVTRRCLGKAENTNRGEVTKGLEAAPSSGYLGSLVLDQPANIVLPSQ
jgi:hypothetical protein